MAGEVVLAAAVERKGARLRVVLEDVSHADRAAPVVAEIVMVLDEPHRANERLGFRLTLVDPDPSAHYALRAHLDATASGEVSEGDQISTIAYPVLGERSDGEVTITLTAI